MSAFLETHAGRQYQVMLTAAKVFQDLRPVGIANLKPGELESLIAKHLPDLTLSEIRDGLDEMLKFTADKEAAVDHKEPS